MKQAFLTGFKQLRSDRSAMIVCIVLLLVTIAYIVYMGISLNPVENQVAVRYTAYGSTNLYRDHWYYLLSFVAFALVILVVHIGLIAKLLERNMHSLAIAIGWLTILLFVIISVLSRSVLSIAYFL